MGKNKKKENKEQNADFSEKINENIKSENTQTEKKIEDVESECEKVEDETQTKIAELEKQVADLKDKYLRQVADFDNYRKHTIKEKSELILNGGEKVVTSLLPVLDDFERAEKNLSESSDINALKEGVALIFKKLLSVLESSGLKKIDTKGKDFNTDFHEAIAMIPAGKDEDKGKVIDCVQAGYMLNDKVIRHSKVAIGQ